jgi:hypothetical protein
MATCILGRTASTLYAGWAIIVVKSKKAGTVFLFANNHWSGQAIDTIRQLRMMLD